MLKIKNYILLVALSLPFFMGCAFAQENTYQGPGFDCAKARTFAEKTICSDAKLSKQDWQLFETYYAVQKPLVGKPYANLINTQHIFLKKRNRCKDNRSCIAKVTSTRIDQLKTLYGKQISTNCSYEDKEYSRSWGVSADEGFNFGLKIQKIVKAKDLQALFALIDGELKIDEGQGSIGDKKFDDLFPPDWRREILLDKPSCSPSFRLGYNKIFYDKDPQASSDGTWKIIAINDALVSIVNRSNRAWIYKGKTLTVDCFTTPSLSGDLYDFYVSTYIEDKNINISFIDAKKFIGRFVGKQVPIEPVPSPWDTTKYINLAVNIKKCTATSKASSDKDDRATYIVINSIPRHFCKTLVPNLADNCRQLRLITVDNDCGGSMGCNVNTGIYGIVDDPKTKETYVVPLANLGTLNDALNFVDELEKGTPTGGSQN